MTLMQFQFVRIPMWTVPFAQMGGETNENDLFFVQRFVVVTASVL